MTDIEKNNIKVTENDVPKSESVEVIDLAYIFKQIKEIQTQTEYLNEVINTLSQMSDGDSGEGCSREIFRDRQKLRRWVMWCVAVRLRTNSF